VTINRSIHAGKNTVIGENCFMMAASHAAHDCEVGNNVVFANAALLAGHVSVGDHTFLGGGAAVHQFCRIGEGVMVAGHASITRDVPHFTMVAERDDVIGFNVVGLKRRGVGRAAIAELKAAFQDVYFTAGNIREVAAGLMAGGKFTSAEARKFLEFFSGGKRSFARARRTVTARDGGMMTAKLAFTCGDPAGVGPEIIAAWLAAHPEEAGDVAVIGPARWLGTLETAAAKIPVGLEDFAATPGMPTADGRSWLWRRCSGRRRAAWRASFAAWITGPVSKEWLARVGYTWPGQTEFFAAQWGGEPVMAFCGGKLRVVLATWHIPLVRSAAGARPAIAAPRGGGG